MKYPFENFPSTYELITLKEKSIIIFNDHNMALPIWGTFSNLKKKSLTLITLDTHTDTQPHFNKKISVEYGEYNKNTFRRFEKNDLSKYSCSRVNFSFEDAFCLSIEFVAHDEHIHTACYYDYIDRYYIFCDLDKSECKWHQQTDQDDGFSATYHSRNDILSLPEEEIIQMCTKDYILDFDLDYFTTRSMIDNITLLEKLTPIIKNATCITIAKEPEFFDETKQEDNFTNNEALNKLLSIITIAINE